MKKQEVVKKMIIYIAILITGILAIAVCIFMGAIMVLWKMTDKILRKLK